MIVQCTIEREGSTFMTYGGAQYEFKHRPELTKHDTAKTCEVTASHAQDFFLSMPGFEKWEDGRQHAAAPHDHDNNGALTKEAFHNTKNHLALKGLINKCKDRDLLLELIDIEASSLKPREWAGEMLANRLEELEAA